jgi:hypothetical protein
MTAARRYLGKIHDKFDLLATWPLDERLQLGDVGMLTGGRFFLRTSLSALRIGFRARSSNGSSDWDHTSGADLSVELQAGKDAIVSFGSSGAFLFQARAAATATIENMAEIGAEILYHYRAHAFERDWIVIDRLVTANSAMILSSESEKARVVLRASEVLVSVAALGDASLGIQIASTEGEVTRLIARGAITPMFGASRLSESLLRGTRVKPVRGDRLEALQGDQTLQRITLDEQLAALPAS